ncbi:methionine--tRNA ligase [Novipirellula artificiosorum]|uniref:Methionine--tRNA ligase n=1 Tax=Novipirellula artificiosorum TaxID=2528016 RepID=A0A5C6DGP4_9BACT|nr:methionine--tRNA ligase [Novipirellula artificiosorum]TWU35990.1 Methionine--tRNA ligase [Novipirellula artificiosorum]
MTRRILVTSALPYANGPIHIGHLVEYIQTDIWVRFQKLRGNRCLYICADDTHGTAIMIRARKEGRSEEELIAAMSKSHQQDFAGFGIEFDNYGSTHSDENRAVCAKVWESLRQNDLIAERPVQQLYDPEAKTFLADRFVRGTCPKCGRADQPGDNCVCGHTYSPTDLVDPKSTLSGATPELREAIHLFVELEKLHAFLAEWIDSSDALQSETANYLKGHFLADELRDWDISRPGPYFGFEIPDSPGNFWYVWFDAPIGYIASTQQWCDANGEKLEDWWNSDQCEIHHFIGKDITYFHTLFWPGMLKSAGFSLPTKVRIHGFLTVAGEKMSKSTGTLVSAETYLKHSQPSYLRYFYATKLTPRVEDLDLGIEEFTDKINSDLVGKVVNLASRVGKFANATGLSKTYPDDDGMFEAAAQMGDEIAAAYEACDFSRAMRRIMELADAANPFVEHSKPWEMKKDPQRVDELRDVCTIALNLFRQLAIYLAPVLPDLATQCGELLGQPITSWDQSKTPLLGTPVAKFKRMMDRVQPEDIEKMIEESKELAAADAASANLPTFEDSDGPLKEEPLAEEITIEEFAKVDLRVARVLNAEQVPEANKLLKLTLSLGGTERRQVFAGIKAAYPPEELIGRLVVMVANLKPRKMRFGLSEGMVAASGPGGAEVFILGVDEGAKPGQRVH